MAVPLVESGSVYAIVAPSLPSTPRASGPAAELSPTGCVVSTVPSGSTWRTKAPLPDTHHATRASPFDSTASVACWTKSVVISLSGPLVPSAATRWISRALSPFQRSQVEPSGAGAVIGPPALSALVDSWPSGCQPAACAPDTRASEKTRVSAAARSRRPAGQFIGCESFLQRLGQINVSPNEDGRSNGVSKLTPASCRR